MKMAISKETRAGIRCVYLPPHDVVVSDVDMNNISDEQDIEYNAWCTNEIKRVLAEIEADNVHRRNNWPEGEELPEYVKTSMARTHYPADDFESEDVVALDRDGEIVVLDSGSR